MIQLEFDKLNQIVIAKKYQEASISDIVEFINKAVSFADKHNCFNILFNMQKAEETGSFLESYELHKNLLQMTDLTYDHCCAVVFSPREIKSEKKFYETVSANSGQGIFKIFFDLEEGLAYLKPRTVRNNDH